MNKSLATNLLALGVLLIGLFLPSPILKMIGLFAVSGAATNWLAVHMLFEKVPGLYGSGVVALHFDEFRQGIRKLMMEQFFTQENVDRFMAAQSASPVDLSGVVEAMDLSPAFDSVVATIEESSFGGMLSMIGGAEGLEGLRQPFTAKLKKSLGGIAESESVQQAIQSGVQGAVGGDALSERISTIITQRLDELTPQMVKEIIQQMIRKHLGWLVVWGGVFGGLIGGITFYINSI